MSLFDWSNRQALITGGLGFIGSNLAMSLIKKGARVTLIDNFFPDHGANWFNIEAIRHHPNLSVNLCDFGDRNVLTQLLVNQEFVFHLAGQVSHILSLKDPFQDIENNVTKTAILMDVIKSMRNKPKVIYTGTRGQYGESTSLPVAETAPTNPKGIYELTNLTAEKLIQIYAQQNQISAILLRLTNIYGPRAQVKHPHFGVLKWFVRLSVEKKPLTIMGTGKILRDFIHVDDCVEALVKAAESELPTTGEVINIGNDKADSYLAAARILAELSGSEIKFIDFSPERAAQEPGDFYSNIDKARQLLDWEPQVDLESGLTSYYNWLVQNLDRYMA
jgi:UDP-glucose 4-epimerase